jgi:hypothetical protein
MLVRMVNGSSGPPDVAICGKMLGPPNPATDGDEASHPDASDPKPAMSTLPQTTIMHT